MTQANTWTLGTEKIEGKGLRGGLRCCEGKMNWAPVAAGLAGLTAGAVLASVIRWLPLMEPGRYAAALAGVSAWLLIGIAGRSASIRDGLSQAGAGFVFFIVAVRAMESSAAMVSQIFAFQAAWVIWSMVFGDWDRVTRVGMVALAGFLAAAGVMV